MDIDRDAIGQKSPTDCLFVRSHSERCSAGNRHGNDHFYLFATTAAHSGNIRQPAVVFHSFKFQMYINYFQCFRFRDIQSERKRRQNCRYWLSINFL